MRRERKGSQPAAPTPEPGADRPTAPSSNPSQNRNDAAQAFTIAARTEPHRMHDKVQGPVAPRPRGGLCALMTRTPPSTGSTAAVGYSRCSRAPPSRDILAAAHFARHECVARASGWGRELRQHWPRALRSRPAVPPVRSSLASPATTRVRPHSPCRHLTGCSARCARPCPTVLSSHPLHRHTVVSLRETPAGRRSWQPSTGGQPHVSRPGSERSHSRQPSGSPGGPRCVSSEMTVRWASSTHTT